MEEIPIKDRTRRNAMIPNNIYKRRSGIVKPINTEEESKTWIDDYYCNEYKEGSLPCPIMGLYDCMFCNRRMCIKHAIRLSDEYKCCNSCYYSNNMNCDIANGIRKVEENKHPKYKKFIKCLAYIFDSDERKKVQPEYY
jgi:hypothetical protein